MSKEFSARSTQNASSERNKPFDPAQERVLERIHAMSDQLLVRLIEEGEFFAVITQYVRKELAQSRSTELSEERVSRSADSVYRAVAVRVRRLLRERGGKRAGNRL